MTDKVKRYKELKEELAYLEYANFVMNYDSVTDCPLKDRERSTEVQDYFTNKMYDITLSDEYSNLIIDLYQERDSLDEVLKKDVEIEYKDIVKLKRIPRDELDKHIENLSKCYLEWEHAHDTLDFTEFEKAFEELVEFNKKYMVWEEHDGLKGFDIILDDMEEGATQAKYDAFFNALENDLLPFVKEVLKQPLPYNKVLDTLKFDINKQKEITKIIADQMGYTNEVGCIKETIHPFTNWANNNDVRITTNYSEDLLFSNIYSVTHEIGHALYQLQMDDKYNDTNVFNNVGCILHESQSRFYENYLTRRRSFVEYLYPILKKFYPEELKDITVDDIYNYVNSVKAQPRRTEADELTYPFHVLVRYNVEKKLLKGEIMPCQVSETFNYYLNKYLGVNPENKLIGCFQDSHWTASFGYFPTYAVASAYGAMLYKEMEKDIDIDEELRNGRFTKINAWLKEKVHKYSGMYNSEYMLKKVTNREFDVNDYITYLKDKFSKIYHI